MRRIVSMIAAALLLVLSGCGGGGGGDGGSEAPRLPPVPEPVVPPEEPQPPQQPQPPSLPSQIPVTRMQCTPFGAPPRPVVAAETPIVPTCLPGTALPDWTDPEGSTRKACLYQPPQAFTPGARLPLVVFLHPSKVGPDLALFASRLDLQLATADLSGDPARPGFILMAPLGRVTQRFYPAPDDVALGWDNWYRQLLPEGGSRRVNDTDWPQNLDAAAVDHYIDEVLDMGRVDTDRIYVLGWSNGGAFGILYALNRPDIAAAAIYSAPTPFGAFNDPCPQFPTAEAPADDRQVQLLNPGVPVYHLHNDCDFGGICPTARVLGNSLLDGGLTGVSNQIIDSAMAPVDACVPLMACPAETGIVNHTRWPTSWTETLFRFLRDNPR